MLVSRGQLVTLRHVEIMRRLNLANLLAWYETFPTRPVWVDSSTASEKYPAKRPESAEAAQVLVNELRIFAGECVINDGLCLSLDQYRGLSDLSVSLLRRDGAAAHVA